MKFLNRLGRALLFDENDDTEYSYDDLKPDSLGILRKQNSLIFNPVTILSIWKLLSSKVSEFQWPFRYRLELEKFR